ncbi:YbjN domain-containing protein [Pseudomonas sp. ABC1]|uniref:YbjN domain-containing protein n=1 Tax=Pseudomonas sp. ABC1 TaxID=2748080 RepID=UPI0015C385CB|nr:YbjN domain-containing protein [Pseudomonas sp. ABC1]QLF93444.1 YbjN domain-containing protein [Pseudomonas sp. ABC1]
MNAPTLIESVSADSLTNLLQESGYRVNRAEQGGSVQLLSASQGVGYTLRFGNPAATEGQYLDFTFSCALHIQGELPENLVNQWNASRRFSRLSVQGGFLVLEKDVVVAEGVGARYLAGSLLLWDRLLQEFIVYLRDYGRDNLSAATTPAQGQPGSDA